MPVKFTPLQYLSTSSLVRKGRLYPVSNRPFRFRKEQIFQKFKKKVLTPTLLATDFFPF